MKKLIVFLLSFLLFIPSALAENYKIVDIYEERVPILDISLYAGDKITGGNGITITLSYFDADDNSLGNSNGSIKSFTINGKKCTEWRVVDGSSSVIVIGNILRGAFAYTLKPAYTVADSEGYYLISEDTYSSYINNNEKSLEKQVKFTGQIIAIDDQIAYVAIAKDTVVVITADDTVETPLAVNGRISCKGKVMEYITHNDQMIPSIVCNEIIEQSYESLQSGNSGAEVLAMKERLQELGYFTAGAELSDRYNATCVERVKMFQKRNGLPQTGEADIETLIRLYSYEAVANQ